MADRRRQAGYVDYDLLTPLEHELYKVVLSVKISRMCPEGGYTGTTTPKGQSRPAREHAINLTRQKAKEGEG